MIINGTKTKRRMDGSESSSEHCLQVPSSREKCFCLQLLQARPSRPEAHVPNAPSGHSRMLRQRKTWKSQFSLRSTQRPACCLGDALLPLQAKPTGHSIQPPVSKSSSHMNSPSAHWHWDSSLAPSSKVIWFLPQGKHFVAPSKGI